jgi:hypothetical protein
MYQSAAKSLEYSAQVLDQMTGILDCLSASFIRNKHFSEAVATTKKSLHYNPTAAHVWFNNALVREEHAVDILNRWISN